MVRNGILPLLAALCGAILACGDLAAQSAGTINFSRRAGPDFDVYTAGSQTARQQWLRDHFSSMTVYSPYFDNKTKWYSRAIFYDDLYSIPRGSQLQAAHPEWILKDGNGNWLSIPWGCGNGTCPQWAADVSNPDFRAWWINDARAVLGRGYYGIWIDDVNLEFQVGDGNGNRVAPVDRNTGQIMTWENWRRYVAEFTEQIRQSLPGVVLVHNSVWFAGPAGVRDSDSYIQRQIAAADIINVERGIGSDDGLTGGTGSWSTRALLSYIDRVHAKGRAVLLEEFSEDSASQEYALAGYFLISTGRDQTGDQISTPDYWWSGYNVNLGDPLGPYTYSNGLFRRDFTGGTVLLNEPGGPVRNIDAGGVYSTIAGASVSSVTLGGRQAAILLKVAAGSASTSTSTPTAPPGSTVRYLSDLNWTSAVSGWGPPERNTSNGESAAGDGHALRLNGRSYVKGLGTHAYSEIHYALAGQCSSLSAVAGIDDEVPAGKGSMVFQVWADGVKLYDSGRFAGGSAAVPVSADLTGRYDVSLVVTDAGDGNGYDHADWADAKITCGP